MTRPPAWDDLAAALPLAFAQVREDPAVDLAVLGRLRRPARVCLVASGGCTVAALAADPRVTAITAVDPNPAQLALTRLKLHLLATADPPDRLAWLGHVPMDGPARGAALAAAATASGVPLGALGPLDLLAALGPDQCGRYERLFEAWRRQLAPHAEPLDAICALADPVAQAARIAPATVLGRALDAAYAECFALPVLVRLFGEGATANPVQPFARHFAERTRAWLSTRPASSSPWLAQMWLGRFGRVTYPWLAQPRPSRVAPVEAVRGTMRELLTGVTGTYDVVGLSNILDWCTPADAGATLAAAWGALRPHGAVVVRQLNSTLDVRAAGAPFAWDATGSVAALAEDRSFFYRALHIGWREGPP